MKKLQKQTQYEVFDYLLSVLAAAAIILQGSYFPFQYMSLLVLLCLLLFIKFIANKGLKSPDLKILVPGGLLCFLYLISTLFASAAKYNSILETFKILVFILFMIAVSLQEQIIHVIKGVFYGCLITAVLGLMSYMDMFEFPKAVLNDGVNLRFQSTIQYANITAVFMGIGFFLSLYFMTNSPEHKNRLKFYLYSFVFFVSMLLTLSRGTLLVFLPMLVLWMILNRSLENLVCLLINSAAAFFAAYMMNKLAATGNYTGVTAVFLCMLAVSAIIYCFIDVYIKDRKLLLKLIIAFTAMMTIIVPVLGRSGLARLSKVSFKDGTVIERFIYFKDALTAVKEHLVFGLGPGGWSSRQYAYQTAQYYAKYVHNGLMQIMLDAGIAAVIIFTGIMVVFYIRNIKTLKNYDPLTAVAVIIVTFILLHSFMDVDLSFVSVMMVLAIFISVPSFSNVSTGSFKVKKESIWFTYVPLILIFATALFYLSGFLLFSQGEAAEAAGNLDRSAGYYESSKFFRPFDGEVYVKLANISARKELDQKEILQLYDKAYMADVHNPRFLREALNYVVQAKRFDLMYDTSLKLLQAESLNPDNYKTALDGLKGLLDSNNLNAVQFNERAEEIVRASQKAQAKISPYSKYLRDQKPVVVDEYYKSISNQIK